MCYLVLLSLILAQLLELTCNGYAITLQNVCAQFNAPPWTKMRIVLALKNIQVSVKGQGKQRSKISIMFMLLLCYVILKG